MTLTPGQQEVWDLHTHQKLTVAEIARRVGRNESSIRERLKRAESKMRIDPAVKSAMDSFGIETVPSTVWIKSDEYSIQIRPERQGEASFLDLVQEKMSDLPAAMPVPAPSQTVEDLMAVYPVFDLHLGLRAHAEVSGREVSLESASDEILAAMTDVLDATPNARRGVIINGGDFTHQTDDRNMTRRSSNILDVSARNARTVDVAIEVLATLIEMALRKHETVEYYSVPGNHDPQNWETIQFALRERYRANPRVIINVRWDEFSIVEHGEVALFVHHGDKRAPKDLVLFCAAAFKDTWTRSNYRMLLTGHLHHLKVDEFPGMIWVQLSAASARDHHAASHAYFSHRILTAMVFNRRARKFALEALL
jgi:predicted phosphodiesterase